jgi:rhomboid protease GluP
MTQPQTPGERRHPLERPPAGFNPPPPQENEPRRIPVQMPRVAPTVTYVLIAINVLIFIIRALSPDLDEQLYRFGASNPARVLLDGEYYRLLTAMFLHASIYGARDALVLSNALHLILNMYMLYAVGQSLEAVFGHARFLVIYLAGGLMGSVFSAVLSDFNVFSVGASGAVFAIIGAQFIYLYKHRTLFGPRAEAQMRSLVMWGLINFAYGALTSVAGTTIRIDNWGHLGGLVGGLILTWFLSPVYAVKRAIEAPNMLVAQDSNPLQNRVPVILAYGALLVGILVVAVLLRTPR